MFVSNFILLAKSDTMDCRLTYFKPLFKEIAKKKSDSENKTFNSQKQTKILIMQSSGAMTLAKPNLHVIFAGNV